MKVGAWISRALVRLAWIVARAFYLTYIFAFRIALYAVGLSLLVYFTVNSSWFNTVIYGVIDDALPGAIHIETIQWGPVPWQVRTVGVNITHPDGTSVIRSDQVYGEVDLVALFRWLGPELASAIGVPGAAMQRTGFQLVVTGALVRDFDVVLDFLPEDPIPQLAYAFDDLAPAVGPPGRGTYVHIREAFGANGRCTLRFPTSRNPDGTLVEGFDMVYEGISFDHGQVDIVPGSTTVYAPATHIDRGQLSFSAAIAPLGEGALTVPVADFDASDFMLLHDRIRVGGAEFLLGGSHVRTQGMLSFPSLPANAPDGATPPPNAFDAEVSAGLDGADPLVRQLLGDVWTAGATVWLRGSGTFSAPRLQWQWLADEGQLLGFPLDSLRAAGTLSRASAPKTAAGDPAEPDGPWWAHAERVEAEGFGGRIIVEQAAAELQSGRFSATSRLVGIDPARVATSPALQIPARQAVMLAGEAAGFARVTGHIEPPDATGAPGGLRVEIELGDGGLAYTPALLRAARAADDDGDDGDDGDGDGDPSVEPPPDQLPDSTIRVEGRVALRREPAESFRVEGRPLRVTWGPWFAEWSGELDTERQTLFGVLDAAMEGDLATALGQSGGQSGSESAEFGVRSADISGLRVFGPWNAPTAQDGRLRARESRLGPARFTEATGRLHWAQGRASLDDVSLGGTSPLKLDASLALFDRSWDRPLAHPKLALRRISVSAAPLQWLYPGATGWLDVAEGEVAFDLDRPLASLEASGRVVVRDAAGLPVPVERIEAKVQSDGSRIRVPSAHIRFERGDELSIRDLEYSTRTGGLRGHFDTRRFSIENALRYANATAPVKGSLEASLDVRWGQGDTVYEGTLRLRDMVAGGVRLGDTELTLSDLGSGRTAVTAEDFWLDSELLEGSEIQWDASGLPSTMRFEVAFEDLDPMAVLGLSRGRARSDGANGANGANRAGSAWITEFTGTLLAEYDASRPDDEFRALLTVPDGGARVEWEDGLSALRLDNRGTAELRWGAQSGLFINHFIARSQGLEVATCGGVSPRGELSLFIGAQGRLELPDFARGMLSSLDASITTLSTGRDVSAACASTFEDFDATPVAVRGTLFDPIVAGAVVLDVPTARIRGLPGELRLEPGSLLEFDTVRQGTRRLVVLRTAADQSVRGQFGEGRFELTGEAYFDAWALDSIDVHVDAVNFDWSATKELRLRFNTGFDLKGHDLASGSAPVVTGDIAIVEGYLGSGAQVDHELFGGGSVGLSGRKLGGASRSVTDSVPWLGKTRLDLAATSSNLQVRFSLPVGRADLDLRLDARVRGTVADPELYGRLDVLPGGMIRNTVLGREFEIRRASIDFDGDPATPIISAELRAEVTFQESRAASAVVGSGQVFSAFNTLGAQEKTVGVSVTITGVANMNNPGRELEDIEVDLTSDSGGYERSELFTLLVTGVPPGTDTGTRGEGGGVVNLFADEIASLLAGTLLGIFIDTVNVGISLTGGLDWALRKSFGRNLQVSVTGFQDSSGQRVEPRFELRITERLSLEGALRYQQLEQISGQTYEAKLRYRIPLDK